MTRTAKIITIFKVSGGSGVGERWRNHYRHEADAKAEADEFERCGGEDETMAPWTQCSPVQAVELPDGSTYLLGEKLDL